MDKTLAYKVIDALNKYLNEENVQPFHSELEPIAERLGAKLRSGATRWAFVFEKHQMVIKFPRYEDTDEDYCELELENYIKARDEYKVERCLLPIEYVDETASGIPIYIQPMYSFSHEGMDYGTSERWVRKLHGLHRAEIVRKVERGCLYSPPRLWVERAIQIYGKAFMRSFEQWSKDCKVDDLHSSNVGYLGKQPIIIDYAGYHG